MVLASAGPFFLEKLLLVSTACGVLHLRVALSHVSAANKDRSRNSYIYFVKLITACSTNHVLLLLIAQITMYVFHLLSLEITSAGSCAGDGHDAVIRVVVNIKCHRCVEPSKKRRPGGCKHHTEPFRGQDRRYA